MMAMVFISGIAILESWKGILEEEGLPSEKDLEVADAFERVSDKVRESGQERPFAGVSQAEKCRVEFPRKDRMGMGNVNRH